MPNIVVHRTRCPSQSLNGALSSMEKLIITVRHTFTTSSLVTNVVSCEIAETSLLNRYKCRLDPGNWLIMGGYKLAVRTVIMRARATSDRRIPVARFTFYQACRHIAGATEAGIAAIFFSHTAR